MRLRLLIILCYLLATIWTILFWWIYIPSWVITGEHDLLCWPYDIIAGLEEKEEERKIQKIKDE